MALVSNPKRIFAKKNSVLGYDRRIEADDFKHIEGEEVLLQCVRNILSTPRGRRVRDCTFGSELYKFLYEPADEITIESIEREVKASLEEQDERLRLKGVDVYFFSNSKGFKVDVHLVLKGGEHISTSVEITPEVFEILE